MGEIIAFLLAIMSTLTAVLFGLATINSPYPDITRAHTSLLTIFFTVTALGFWVLWGVLLDGPGDASPEDDNWRRAIDER